jgi:hypothetical protein
MADKGISRNRDNVRGRLTTGGPDGIQNQSQACRDTLACMEIKEETTI